jgi:hypothetical protein
MHVQVSVVGEQGAGATARVEIGGQRATPCGAGCYRAVVPVAAQVEIRADATRWNVPVPRNAAPADAIVTRAARAWRALRSVAWSETLASDAEHAVRSTWTAEAPDRVAYVVENGGSSVVIGRTRWDKPAGGAWTRSAQDPPLRQPVPFWTRATDAQVVSRSPGRAVVTFYDPGTPGWYRIVVDTKTWRTLALDMTATAHFMHDRYSRFDAARVTAPR